MAVIETIIKKVNGSDVTVYPTTVVDAITDSDGESLQTVLDGKMGLADGDANDLVTLNANGTVSGSGYYIGEALQTTVDNNAPADKSDSVYDTIYVGFDDNASVLQPSLKNRTDESIYNVQPAYDFNEYDMTSPEVNGLKTGEYMLGANMTLHEGTENEKVIVAPSVIEDTEGGKHSVLPVWKWKNGTGWGMWPQKIQYKHNCFYKGAELVQYAWLNCGNISDVTNNAVTLEAAPAFTLEEGMLIRSTEIISENIILQYYVITSVSDNRIFNIGVVGDIVTGDIIKIEAFAYIRTSLFTKAVITALYTVFTPEQVDTILNYSKAHMEIVPYINSYAEEDPKIVYSLVPLDKQRGARIISGYCDTSLLVTRTNWDKIRYVLDARPTTLNVGNNWVANGIGGNSICCLHVGLNNGSTNYTHCPFTYANGLNDVSLDVYGSYGNRYKWDFDVQHATYKVYNASGYLICDKVATLRAPTEDNTSGGITIGKWHKYNDINSGNSFSIDVFGCEQYINGLLINKFIPFKRNGEMHILNLVSGQIAVQQGTFTEILEPINS